MPPHIRNSECTPGTTKRDTNQCSNPWSTGAPDPAPRSPPRNPAPCPWRATRWRGKPAYRVGKPSEYLLPKSRARALGQAYPGVDDVGRVEPSVAIGIGIGEARQGWKFNAGERHAAVQRVNSKIKTVGLLPSASRGDPRFFEGEGRAGKRESVGVVLPAVIFSVLLGGGDLSGGG